MAVLELSDEDVQAVRTALLAMWLRCSDRIARGGLDAELLATAEQGAQECLAVLRKLEAAAKG